MNREYNYTMVIILYSSQSKVKPPITWQSFRVNSKASDINKRLINMC